LDFALDRKALCPVLLNVSEIAGYTDWVLLLSGRSDRHVAGITDAIIRGLKGEGLRPTGSDGLDEHLWALIDYSDFIVHIFYHPVRIHYDLEGMWSDAPRAELNLPAEVMDTEGLAELEAPNPMPAYRGNEFGGFDDEFEDELEDEFESA
jgi:ribosome-associated protein